MSTKSTKLTKANWVAIIGLALLFFGIGIGQIFATNGEWSNSALYALAGVAICGALIAVLVKVKGQANKLGWRIIEYGILLAYISFAILTVKPISYFFWANDNKEQFKQVLNNDIESVKRAYNEYEKFEKDALNNTKSGLNSAVRFPSSQFSPALSSKMEKLAIKSDLSSVDNFIKIQESVVLGSDYYTDRDAILAQTNKLQAEMESSNVLFFPSNIKKIELLSSQVSKNLEARSRKSNLFVVEYPYNIEKDNQIFVSSLTTNDNRDNSNISIKMPNINIGTTEGILIALLLHCMILLNYIVADRTFDVGLARQKESKARGIVLNISKKRK